MSATAQGIPVQFSASTDVNSFFIPVSTGITGPSGNPLTAFQIKTIPQKSLLFNITGSVSGLNVGFGGAPSTSGSVQLLKAPNPQPTRNFIRETDYTILGESVFIKQLGASITNGSGQFDFIATGSVEFNDLLYLRVIGFTDTVPRNPTSFTASLNSFRITSTPTGSAKELVVEPYLTSPFYGTDCDVTYGNVSQPVSNPFLQDIDYGNGTIIPINNDAIISGSAVKGTVPESYYTSLAQTTNRYKGSKNQTEKINEWTISRANIGNFGKTPSINSNSSLIVYCDWIGGNKPEKNNSVAAHIQYIINSNGEVEQPNLKSFSVKKIKHAFESEKNIIINLTDPPAGGGMEVLNGLKKIIRGGSRIESILYTQSGSLPDIHFTSSIGFRSTEDEGAPSDVRASYSYTGPQTINDGTATKVEYDSVNYGSAISNNSYKATVDVVSNNISLIFSPQLVFNTTGQTLADLTTQTSNTDITFLVNVVRKRGSNLKYYPFIPETPYQSVSNPNLFEYNVYSTLSDGVTGGFVIGGNKDTYTIIFNTGFIKSAVKLNPITVPAGDIQANDEFYIDVTIFKQSSLGITLENDSEFFINESLTETETFSTSIIVDQDPAFVSAVSSPFWDYSGSGLTHITSSIDLGKSYGLYNQSNLPNSGFTNISLPFTLQSGDEFRFEGSENFVYPIKSVVEPQNNNSRIKVEFYNPLPQGTGFNLNNFSVRRYVDDGSFILFEGEKPGGATGPSIIKPQYTTDKLQKDVNEIIVDLTDKGLIS